MKVEIEASTTIIVKIEKTAWVLVFLQCCRQGLIYVICCQLKIIKFYYRELYNLFMIIIVRYSHKNGLQAILNLASLPLRLCSYKSSRKKNGNDIIFIFFSNSFNFSYSHIQWNNVPFALIQVGQVSVCCY